MKKYMKYPGLETVYEYEIDEQDNKWYDRLLAQLTPGNYTFILDGIKSTTAVKLKVALLTKIVKRQGTSTVVLVSSIFERNYYLENMLEDWKLKLNYDYDIVVNRPDTIYVGTSKVVINCTEDMSVDDNYTYVVVSRANCAAVAETVNSEYQILFTTPKSWRTVGTEIFIRNKVSKNMISLY